jgi:hypothetical protein
MDDGSGLPQDFDSLREMILGQREALPKRIAGRRLCARQPGRDRLRHGGEHRVLGRCAAFDLDPLRAQHLGYDGFTSLQSVFRERLRERTSSYDERLNALRGGGEGSQNRRILEGFVAASSQSLDAMLRNLDDTALESAVAKLAKAETVYIVARRRSIRSPVISPMPSAS